MIHPLKYYRQWKACRDLNRLVTARREAFETRDYVKRRAAMLKAMRSNLIAGER